MIRQDCLRDLGMTLDEYILRKIMELKQPLTTKWPLSNIKHKVHFAYFTFRNHPHK